MPVVSLNVPHCKQEHHYSCVAAGVRMVLAHYGRSHSEDELRQLMGTDPHGTSARDILRVSSLGFAVRTERRNASALRAVSTAS